MRLFLMLFWNFRNSAEESVFVIRIFKSKTVSIYGTKKFQRSSQWLHVDAS